MATEAVEDYLKAVYTLCRESPTGEAAMSRLAVMVGVTTGTATSMIKKLAAANLTKYERFGGVRLTSKGERAAIDILRRHRLVETFLVQTLKLDWTVVHAEAERLEHALSPIVLEALDAHLGRPAVDPHGDPIPDPSGRIRDAAGRPLRSFPPGSAVRIMRIGDQDRTFLEFVASSGLKPGARATIVGLSTAGDSMTVRPKGRAVVAISLSAADKLWAEPDEQ